MCLFLLPNSGLILLDLIYLIVFLRRLRAIFHLGAKETKINKIEFIWSKNEETTQNLKNAPKS